MGSMVNKKGKKKIRVVVADDHPAIRLGFQSLLRRAKDIDVVGEASNGIEAVEMAKRIQPEVLVLDIEMPLMDGLEVASMIREAQIPVNVLIVSAYADRQLIEGALGQGVNGYMTKDEAPDMIVRAVRAVANDETGWFSKQVEHYLLE